MDLNHSQRQAKYHPKVSAQAIEWLRKAVVLARDSAAGHFALGNALFQQGDSGAAIPELNVSL